MKNFLFFLFALSSFTLSASEIDSFTARYEPLIDSLETVNEVANGFLDRAIVESNAKNHGCKEEKLYKGMRKYFKNSIAGEVTKAILLDERIDKRVFHLKDSIYREMNWWNSFILVVVGPFYKKAHGAVLNVNGYLIGTDKFEHLFGRGYLYFKRHRMKGKELEGVLKYGRWQEKWTLGSKTTGVFSYADQSANFNGMRFWNHILQLRDDFFDKNYGPLIECQDNKWVKIKPLNFAPFIDNSMDEGLNCSKFSSKRITRQVKRQIKRLERADGKNYTCPVSSDSIDTLNEKYGSKLAPYLFNFKGHAHL